MNRTRRLLGLTIVVALALAACGSDKKTGSDGSTTSAGNGAKSFTGSITLAVNPWDGSAANAAVAKIVLEQQGMTVKLKDIDENAVWAALDSDTIDANLEVWPSGHAKDIETYITTKKSEVDGLICARIPSYGRMADLLGLRHPRIVHGFEGTGRMSGLALTPPCSRGGI